MSWAIFKDEHITAIDEIENSPSERITAIVGGAVLDNTLERTLSERLRDDDNIRGKLLRTNGPLGNTQPKIDLLYMLGAFEKPLRNCLYGIAEVRNCFAHRLDTSFDSADPKMVQAISKLTLHVGRKYYSHHFFDRDADQEIEKIESTRDIFLVNLKLSLLALMRDRVSHCQFTNKPRTPEEIDKVYQVSIETRRPRHGGEAST